MTNVVSLPCAFEIKQTARAVLSDPGRYPKDTVLAAIQTLEHERDWETRRLVSTAQNRYLWAVPGSDIVPADAPQSGDNFRRLTDEQMAAIGMPTRKQMVRPDAFPDFERAAADSAADLRKMFAPFALAILAAVAIGVACELYWRAL